MFNWDLKPFFMLSLFYFSALAHKDESYIKNVQFAQSYVMILNNNFET